MHATDVMETLNLARASTGVDRVQVVHRPRLLSDSGPCYLSQPLATYLDTRELPHTLSVPYHPMTQGKLERYHRSLENVVKLNHDASRLDLERPAGHFVEDDNHRRYHEALQNVTPADAFFGRQLPSCLDANASNGEPCSGASERTYTCRIRRPSARKCL